MTLPRRLTISAVLLLTFAGLCLANSDLELNNSRSPRARHVSLLDAARNQNNSSEAVVFASPFSGMAPWKLTAVNVASELAPWNSDDAPDSTGRLRFNPNAPMDYRHESVASTSDDPISSIPEPSPLPLVATGVLAIFGLLRRNATADLGR
jgi:hypothetical protein